MQPVRGQEARHGLTCIIRTARSRAYNAMNIREPCQMLELQPHYIQNVTFEEIELGAAAQLVRTLRPEDIHLFAAMSGDVNPTHVDVEYARSSEFREVVAHGMWSGTLISTLLGTEYPGPGTVYIGQTLSFHRPVTIGDTITVTYVMAAYDEARSRSSATIEITKGSSEVVASAIHLMKWLNR